ncbi:MAG TPA: nucleotidyl transferase, partial [Thermoanaerobaculia bacterium]|nr:nucleotidyl transferase [Thermoanaerobaculia bacterium]
LRAFEDESALGLMTVYKNEGRWDASNVIFREGRLLKYDKGDRSPEMTHIDYGAMILRKETLERIPVGEPFDLAALLSALVAEGRMAGFEVFQRFFEIGSPAGLAETEAFLARAKSE